MRFDLAGRMAHPPTPDTPAEEVVRPFDDASMGSVMGEGGGLVVLEHIEQATSRGARVYAELAGFGAGQGPMLSLSIRGANPTSTESRFETVLARRFLPVVALGDGDALHV